MRCREWKDGRMEGREEMEGRRWKFENFLSPYDVLCGCWVYSILCFCLGLDSSSFFLSSRPSPPPSLSSFFSSLPLALPSFLHCTCKYIAWISPVVHWLLSIIHPAIIHAYSVSICRNYYRYHHQITHIRPTLKASFYTRTDPK